jgi:hypothetical protein
MASPMRAVAEVLSQLMHPNRAADIIRMADADPAFAAKLMEAVQADDFGRSLRMLVADAQWGAAPARPAPARPAVDAPPTTAQRMMANPDIQSQIQSNMGGLPPELAQRIQAGDPDAAVEAYQMIAAAEGELPPFRRIGESLGDDPAMLQQAHSAMRDGYPVPFDSFAEEVMDPAILGEFPPAQQELMRELAANEWLGFDYPSQAANAVLSFDAGNFEMSPGLMRARAALIGGQSPPPARQMELPLGGENELPSRGLIPFGVRGEGVPVGGPTGMGTARDVAFLGRPAACQLTCCFSVSARSRPACKGLLGRSPSCPLARLSPLGRRAWIALHRSRRGLACPPLRLPPGTWGESLALVLRVSALVHWSTR